MKPDGLKVVVIGGGHGLEATIKAALQLGASVTAVVGVADDGGSSGRLRSLYGVTPPGDLRRCLSILVEPERPEDTLLEYRFRGGDLEGHALGNFLLLAAAEQLHSLSAATLQIGRLFGAQGQVLPVAEEPLVLGATLVDGTHVSGQVEVHRSTGIVTVDLTPSRPVVSAETRRAIVEADLFLLGPGSLYTSVLAALMVDGVRDLLNASSARSVFLANLKEQREETVGMDLGDHLAAVHRHGVRVDTVLADLRFMDKGDISSFGGELVDLHLSDDGGATHSVALLLSALGPLLQEWSL